MYYIIGERKHYVSHIRGKEVLCIPYQENGSIMYGMLGYYLLACASH